jgi:hypothetical protein
MKINVFNQSLCFAVLIVFTQALHAQSCAGGVGGGMDATGNECSDARWLTNDAARIVLPTASTEAAPNVRSAERPASGPLKAASKGRTAGRTVLAGVDGRHVAKHASGANHPVAVVEHQTAIKSVPPGVPR